MKYLIIILLSFKLIASAGLEKAEFYNVMRSDDVCSSYNFKYRFMNKLSFQKAEEKIKELIKNRNKPKLVFPQIYKVFYKNKVKYKIEIYNGYLFPSYIIYLDRKERPVKEINSIEKNITIIKYINNKKIFFNDKGVIDCYCLFKKKGKLKKTTCETGDW